MSEKRITINVSEKMHEDFKTVAFLKGSTMTKILIKYVEEVINKNKSSVAATKKQKTKQT